MSNFTNTLHPNMWVKLRDGSLAQVTGSREALMLDGKTRELIWTGKFAGGGLIAWNSNGTYRASNKHNTHPLDICSEVD